MKFGIEHHKNKIRKKKERERDHSDLLKKTWNFYKVNQLSPKREYKYRNSQKNMILAFEIHINEFLFSKIITRSYAFNKLCTYTKQS